MNDIAKMRAEFEEKIRLAELENKYNEPLQQFGIQIVIIDGNSLTQKGKIHVVVHRADDRLKALTERDAQNALNHLPMTENCRVYTGSKNGYAMLPYRMQTSRAPKQFATILTIEYIHNDLDLTVEFPIDERNPELMQYFLRDQYEIDDSTIGLYYGAVSPAAKGRLKYQPVLSWNCGSVTRFQGGYRQQNSEGHLLCVAESIMNDDFAYERNL